jgi:hypothetical protein
LDRFQLGRSGVGHPGRNEGPTPIRLLDAVVGFTILMAATHHLHARSMARVIPIMNDGFKGPLMRRMSLS